MRKKILLSAVVFLSVLQLSAQLQKNEIYIGVTGEKHFRQASSTGVRPSVSFGLSRHSEVGVYFDYTKFKEANYFNFKERSQIYSIGAFYTYYRYFGRSEKWGWFVNGDLSLNQIRVFGDNSGASLNNQYNETRLSITPGIFYKPSKNVMLHLDFGNVYALHNRYQWLNVRSNFASQINIGITIGVGNVSNKKATAKGIY